MVTQAISRKTIKNSDGSLTVWQVSSDVDGTYLCHVTTAENKKLHYRHNLASKLSDISVASVKTELSQKRDLSYLPFTPQYKSSGASRVSNINFPRFNYRSNTARRSNIYVMVCLVECLHVNEGE